MKYLKLVFWDVQHGSSTYIETPNRKRIVQDLGTGSYSNDNKIFSPLIYMKDKFKIHDIDCIIITHPHKDHIDDILNLEKFSLQKFFYPSSINEENIMKKIEKEYPRYKELYEKYFDMTNSFFFPIECIKDFIRGNPLSSEDNGGVKIQLFEPKLGNINVNEDSIVTVISYAGRKIILPGDNGNASFRKLLGKKSFINAIKDADILLAPHHGRKSGYHSDIFDHFRPKLTIISDGASKETSAVKDYHNMSTGLIVEGEPRYCLTTRNDGVILLKIYENSDIWLSI